MMRFPLIARTRWPAAHAGQFLKRMAVLLCGTFGTALVAFATHLILTRGMSVSGYGRLAALLAAVNVVTPIAVLGMGWFWLELFGREGWRATRWIAPAVRLGLLASLASIALLVSYVAASDEARGAHTALVAMLLVPVLLGQSLAETTAARLQLEERYVALAGWQSLTQLGRAVIAVALFAGGSMDMLVLLAGYAMVGVLSVSISLVSLQQLRHGRIRLVGHDAAARPDPCAVADSSLTWRRVLGEAAPYCVVMLFYLLYSQGVVAVVHFLVGSEAAAIYNVAFLITATVCLIPNVVYARYLPGKLFRWWAHDRAMFASVFHLGVAAHLVMGLAFAVAVAATSGLLVPALFGSRYAAAVPVLLVLAIAIPIRFTQHSYGSALFSREHIGRKIRYMGAAAAASLLLDFALIPVLGLAGAAISTVMAEALLLGLFVYGVRRHVEGIDVSATFRAFTLRSSLDYVGRRGPGALAGENHT
jgi:O-antigen/teichoic acid export membrane protein